MKPTTLFQQAIKSRMQSFSPRINVLGETLKPVKVGSGPTTGFYRNNYCDASEMDRASHTVAATVTPEFLSFSASLGNDLRSILSPGCTWCLCAARWQEAVLASATHPDGDKIVPRVHLDQTHTEALGKVTMAQLEKYKVGGETCAPVNSLREV